MHKYILALDDNIRILSIIKKALDKDKYVVVTYSHPGDALEYFRNTNIKYDLIMTDIEMPVMSGHEFIKEIKNIDPDIRTIGMSGSKNIDMMKDHFHNFLEKPFQLNQLKAIIDETIL